MDLRKVLEEQILDEINREELLAARIRQLERRSEDVEQVTTRMKEVQTNNTAQRTKRIGATPTEEDRGRRLGAGVDNQHRSMHKFTK